MQNATARVPMECVRQNGATCSSVGSAQQYHGSLR